MLCKIGCFIIFSLSLFGTEHVYLKTPDLSRENIIGTNVGIRPYRKSGVRLESETFHDKLIIHNYGYGGSGLTLCFGGAKEVTNILNALEPLPKPSTSKRSKRIPIQPPKKTVAILGGGVIGLATAYDLLEKGYEVHIYADKWIPNVTSNVGAGIWSPAVLPENAPEEKKKLNARLLEASEQRLLLSAGKNPEFAGIRFIDSYSFKSGTSEGAIKTKHRGSDVIVHFDNGVTKIGRRARELCIDGKLFIEDLFSKVKAKGATLIQVHFESREDLLKLEENIIINCTSLGSHKLFNDQDFNPVRGQLIYFKPQRGFDYLLYQSIPNDNTHWVSIYPWSDRIILGGVYENGIQEPVVNSTILDLILENAEKCLSGKM